MNKIITIGRQYAAGGRLIGETLAKRLGFEFFDKELITLAAKESGLHPEFYEKADEKKRFSLAGFFHVSAAVENFSDNYISSGTLFKIQSDVIRSLAETRNCVFVGRGSDYVLRDMPNVLNIFITANTSDRINCLRKRENLPNDAESLLEILDKTDRKRADFYNYFTNKQWGNAASYHFTVNSSLLGVEQTADCICRVAEEFFV